MNKLDWSGWFYSLLHAVIGGAANSATAMVVDPVAFNFNDLGKLLKLFAVAAVISLVMFLKQSPLPKADGPNGQNGRVGAWLPWVLGGGLGTLATGCRCLGQSAFWTVGLVLALGTGCTTAVQNGYIVSQTTRGLGFKLSAISQSGTPGEVYFGYFSTTAEFLPTAKGTNGNGAQIASPNYGASFSFRKTGLLNEDLDETRSSGLMSVLDSGATNSAPVIQPR